jgi:hypothetical protein
LLAGGYRVARLRLAELFPWTERIESITLLEHVG